jgi:NAD(P)-dependent dehydrogenase (short-subunit alcohol dehydrogenase family)
MSIELKDKVAIITGGSRGIGEAMALAFVEAGAKVVVASRKAEGVQAVAARIGAAALAVAAHTGKEAECSALVDAAVKHFGKVDVLVNNAATNPHFGPLMTAEMPAWDKTFEVNLKGYFWMSREVAKHLIARGAPGAIVNVTSVAAIVAAPMQGVYGMTKAAVVSMTKTLAFELAPSQIRVNAIAPGLVDTRLASAIVHNEDFVKRFTERTPLGRYAQPEEIAGGAVYLSSDAAKFLTGHTLVIDGGMTVC